MYMLWILIKGAAVFFMPPPCSMERHIVSPLSIRPVCTVRPVRNTNCFRAIPFEKIGVLD